MLEDLKLSQSTDNTITTLIFDSAPNIPSKVAASIAFLDKSYKPTTLHPKTKQKKERKTNKATRLLPYRVHSPPVTLIITSTSAKKVTFTQTRAHKYLSVRTQMDDIFQGSSLYAISLLQFLHEDKEMGCCG